MKMSPYRREIPMKMSPCRREIPMKMSPCRREIPMKMSPRASPGEAALHAGRPEKAPHGAGPRMR